LQSGKGFFQKTLMTHKFFPLDKNYILKEAQASCQKDLLSYMVKEVIRVYLVRYNPLDLEDDTILKIKSYQVKDLSVLRNFYLAISGVYRFKYGNNQLEFVFDGRSHFDKYQDDWSQCFKNWVRVFCEHRSFLKAVLDLTVFLPGDERKVYMKDNRMKAFVSQFFELRLKKRKGVPVFKIA
jgi:hypothetical protein